MVNYYFCLENWNDKQKREDDLDFDSKYPLYERNGKVSIQIEIMDSMDIKSEID